MFNLSVALSMLKVTLLNRRVIKKIHPVSVGLSNSITERAKIKNFDYVEGPTGSTFIQQLDKILDKVQKENIFR